MFCFPSRSRLGFPAHSHAWPLGQRIIGAGPRRHRMPLPAAPPPPALLPNLGSSAVCPGVEVNARPMVRLSLVFVSVRASCGKAPAEEFV